MLENFAWDVLHMNRYMLGMDIIWCKGVSRVSTQYTWTMFHEMGVSLLVQGVGAGKTTIYWVVETIVMPESQLIKR